MRCRVQSIYIQNNLYAQRNLHTNKQQTTACCNTTFTTIVVAIVGAIVIIITFCGDHDDSPVDCLTGSMSP